MPFSPSPIERLVIAQIERRRRYRPSPRPAEIQPALARTLHALAKCVRRETAAQRAWRTVAPPDLSTRVRVVSLSRGTLTLDAPDQATKFLADRFMSSGGRSALASALGVAITRVKFNTTPRRA